MNSAPATAGAAPTRPRLRRRWKRVRYRYWSLGGRFQALRKQVSRLLLASDLGSIEQPVFQEQDAVDRLSKFRFFRFLWHFENGVFPVQNEIFSFWSSSSSLLSRHFLECAISHQPVLPWSSHFVYGFITALSRCFA